MQLISIINEFDTIKILFMEPYEMHDFGAREKERELQ